RTDVLGETITLGGNLIDTVVTGVVGTIPEPSHIGFGATALLRFDLIASYDLYDRLAAAVNTPASPPPAPQQGETDTAPSASTEPAEAPPPPQQNENWLGGYCCTTYVMLEPDSTKTPAELDARLAGFVERRMTPEMLAMASVQVGAV